MLHRGEGPRRLLTTVLFTDIVGSTERAAQLGDRGWKELVARHHAIVRRALHHFHGHELDTAGDGFFASFERPAQAIECATAIIDDLRPLDVRIRAAIHMGEAEVMGGKVGGITVHVASRALAEAKPDEILVTSTVREVAAGADVTFSDRGVHEFKGVPEDWHLYAVEWRRRELPLPGVELAPGAAAGRRLGARAVAGATVVAAVVTAVGAWALLGGGGSAPPAIVAEANSAVAIDAVTNAVTAVVPTGDTPTGIAVGDDLVWVLRLRAKVLTAVPTGGGTRKDVGLPAAMPTGIAAGGGSAWVAFGYGATGGSASIVRVSATTQRQETIPLEGVGANAIALDERGVWVIDGVANTLTKVDLAMRSPVKTVEVADWPVAVATGEGSVWVAHAASKTTIWRIDPMTLEKTAEFDLSDPPTAIAIAFGQVWVTSTIGNTVTVIDAATNERTTTIHLDVAPRGIAAGADAIWIAGARNALVRIDPASLTVERRIGLPGPAEGVAVSGASVWVTVQQ